MTARRLRGILPACAPCVFGVSAALVCLATSSRAEVGAGDAARAIGGTAGCYSSVNAWLKAKPADCMLGAPELAIYGQIDAGASYQTHAAPFNRFYPSAVQAVVSPQSRGPGFLPSPNNLDQTGIGVRANIPVFSDVKFIADGNAGFDPFSLRLANGPKSLVTQNGLPSNWQQSASDSSRAGQLLNSRGYVGVSSPTFGEVRIGRMNSLSNDVVGAYDPAGGAYAFSLLGASATFGGGMGVTGLAHTNTAIRYSYDYSGVVHVAAMTQVGGFAQGNAATHAYQFNLGFSHAGLAADVVYSRARNAIALSSFSTPWTSGWTPQALQAAYANVSAVLVNARYGFGALTLSGGYQHATLSNPGRADQFRDMTQAVTAQGGGYFVNPYVNDAVTVSAYTTNKRVQVAWLGFKYAVRTDLDVGGGVWRAWQNNYALPTASGCVNGLPYTIAGTGAGSVFPAAYGKGAANGACAGATNAASLFAVYRPLERLDLYAGVIYSKVSGGMANGFVRDDNLAISAGTRLRF